MKSTGIVRKLDELGRITIPIELRRTLGIGDREPLEIFSDENRIVLEKYVPDQETCCSCGKARQNMRQAKSGKFMCLDCLKQFNEWK